MATYIIDYENVSVDGMKGLSELTAEDNLYIFYSEKADRMTFDLYRRLSECRARQEFFRASVGTKNALDFQLVSILGYKVARDEKAAFVIVSRDKGFDCVVKLWASRGVTITRATSIAASLTGEPAEEPTAKPAPKKAAAKKAPKKAAAKPAPQPAGDALTRQVSAQLGAEHASYVGMAVEALHNTNNKSDLNNYLLKKLGGDNKLAGELYGKLKPLLNERHNDRGELLSRVIDPQYVSVVLEAMDARKSKEGVHNYLAKKMQDKKSASEIYKILRKNRFLDDKS